MVRFIVRLGVRGMVMVMVRARVRFWVQVALRYTTCGLVCGPDLLRVKNNVTGRIVTAKTKANVVAAFGLDSLLCCPSIPLQSHPHLNYTLWPFSIIYLIATLRLHFIWSLL